LNPAPSPAEPLHWWERRGFIVAIVLLSALPLLWPQIPPLVDLPGHMGRYRVQLDLAESEALQQYYRYEWRLIGNLGIDLLIVPFAKLFGLELGVKLIVLAIPPLTVAGFLWVAREVHGRVPPTALFAVPLAYNFPFMFGFVNFALSMAFVFLAFGLWLRLARLGRLRWRAALFLPIGLALWVTHAFGWGTLGVLAFSAELVRQHDSGRSWIEAAFRAGLHCLPLAPPILLMLAWRSGDVSGATADWFNWSAKRAWFIMTFRDRWQAFDLAALIVVAWVVFASILVRSLELSRNLAASAVFLLLVYILLPRIVFGSAYADMRLAPYMIAVAVLAVRPKPGAEFRAGRMIAVAGLAFVLARTGGTTASVWMYDRAYQRELAAIPHIPHGARLLSLVGRPCVEDWAMSRLLHLPALAIVRRHAFSNDQWTMDGAQLLDVHFPEAAGFTGDPTQIVVPARCPHEVWRSIEDALRHFPRNAFDHVWLINPPPYDPALEEGLRPIWRDGRSALFEVVR
jgi:hypothetical protein